MKYWVPHQDEVKAGAVNVGVKIDKKRRKPGLPGTPLDNKRKKKKIKLTQGDFLETTSDEEEKAGPVCNVKKAPKDDRGMESVKIRKPGDRTWEGKMT